MNAPDDLAAPFESLDALRRANDELVERVPDSAASLSDLTPELQQQIKRFVAGALATGILLDAPADRRAAQGLIDYWASVYLTTGSSPSERFMSGRAETQLRRFSSDAVQETVKAADSFMRSLSEKERQLAQKILLRLTRLPEGARNSVSWPATFETLFALSDKKRTLAQNIVLRLTRPLPDGARSSVSWPATLETLSTGDKSAVHVMVEKMKRAGIVGVTATPQGDLITLRHEALIRQWPQLRDWVDERVKFRDAALYWLRSGKNSDALLGSDLVKKATTYGDLNELEHSFIDASRRSVRLLRVAVLAAVGLVAALIIGVPQIFDWVKANLYQRWTPDWVDTVKSRQSKPQQRREAMFRLASRDSLSFPGARLTDINLSGISAMQSYFPSAVLQNVQFINAGLQFSTFSQTTMQMVHFKGANLNDSRFDGATISNTIFFEAKVSRAIFDRAQFCAGVNFARADLRHASVRNVSFERDMVPDFTENAWWLAVGWDSKQREWLEERYGSGKPEFWPAVKRELEGLDKDVDKESDGTVSRSDALNSKAWTLAIYGIKLAEARSASEESLQILKKLPANQRDTDRNASFSDTLGYILLQQGDISRALELLKFAADNRPRDEIMFRYAVAQFAAGKKEDALANLRLAVEKQRYFPSHELYLLRSQIKGEFRTVLEELLAQDRSSADAAQASCPGLTPAAVR